MNQEQAAGGGLPFSLQPDERILQVCHRHWIYLWPNILLKLLIALLPLSVIAFVLSSIDAYQGLAAQAFWVVSALWFAYWGLQMFLAWYRYQNDIWAITNQRVVDIFKRHPFSLRMSTADLVNIQDMTIVRDGVLRTVLNYGDLLCQTAAEEQAFRFTGVPRPSEVQALVDRERDRERTRSR